MRRPSCAHQGIQISGALRPLWRWRQSSNWALLDLGLRFDVGDRDRSIDTRLNVFADDATPFGLRDHRARIGIGQRPLVVGMAPADLVNHTGLLTRPLPISQLGSAVMRETTTPKTDEHAGTMQAFAEKLSKAQGLRDGHIVVRMTGAAAKDYFVHCRNGKATLADNAPAGHPLVELIGDPKRIGPVLSGTKDARKVFLAGGLRVRGDIRYVSDLGMRLGLLQQPI
jgi:hypothetical protein